MLYCKCGAKIKGISYKKYKERCSVTGKVRIVQTDEIEDLCGTCLRWSSDPYVETCNTADALGDIKASLGIPDPLREVGGLAEE